MKLNKLFEVVATAIILKEPFESGKKPQYLILKRAAHEKFGAGKWTVPGGKLATEDFTVLSKQTEDYWYNMIESCLRREVEEEVALSVKNIWYLTSLARVTDEGTGNMVISFVADMAGGEVRISHDFDEYAWVTLEEAEAFDLFDGIIEEFYMIERKLAGEKDVEWERIPQGVLGETKSN